MLVSESLQAGSRARRRSPTLRDIKRDKAIPQSGNPRRSPSGSGSPRSRMRRRICGSSICPSLSDGPSGNRTASSSRRARRLSASSKPRKARKDAKRQARGENQRVTVRGIPLLAVSVSFRVRSRLSRASRRRIQDHSITMMKPIFLADCWNARLSGSRRGQSWQRFRRSRAGLPALRMHAEDIAKTVQMINNQVQQIHTLTQQLQQIQSYV